MVYITTASLDLKTIQEKLLEAELRRNELLSKQLEEMREANILRKRKIEVLEETLKYKKEKRNNENTSTLTLSPIITPMLTLSPIIKF